MSDQLQEGIYFRHNETPGRAWRLLLLNIVEGSSRAWVFEALQDLWKTLQDLKSGWVRDLNPDSSGPKDPKSTHVPDSDLTCMIGYGSRLFNPQVHPSLLSHADLRPGFPLELFTKQPPFPSLPWVSDEKRRQASADIGLQFIANTELAVNRAIVEIHMRISDQGWPLQVVDFFSGFGREDQRSWINFYDGTNSMSFEDRLAAMEVRENTNVPWMSYGTFMAFLRLEMNLQSWRKLSREKQELIVGRDKLTGSPLISAKKDQEGKPIVVKMPSCPFTRQSPPGHFDPVRPSDDPILLSSHIHRVNLTRGTPAESDSSNRIYRQGYEFLEVGPNGGLSLGLNFISFQSNADRIRSILGEPGWMGDVNFGGLTDSTDAPNISFLSLVSGLYLAVPPRGAPFPGHTLFT